MHARLADRRRPIRPSPLLLLAGVHRWIGVGLCLMFALWFASGSVLLFVPFPSLSPAERLTHLPRLALGDIHVTPAAALLAAGVSPAGTLRLLQGPDGPTYVVAAPDGRAVLVDAANGTRIPMLPRDGAARLAALFSGRDVRGVAGPFDYDQWIVHQQFDVLRPFYRVDLQGSDGLEIYVSARTGDIVQQTRHAQRAWNYVGAVVHWIYPTLIRRSFAVWDRLVWCLSLIGVCLAVSGLTLGVIRARNSLRRARTPTISPFRGLFRWHHLTGLGAGIFLLTWIFSGWLSMDHGRLFSTGKPSADQRLAYRGRSLEDAARDISLADLAGFTTAGEISLEALGGSAFLVGRPGAGATARIVDLSAASRQIRTRIPAAAMRAAIQAAWPRTPILSIGAVAGSDPYEHIVTEPDAGQLTRAMLADRAGTWVDIDRDTGRIKTLLDRSRRLYRWIYYGMHTFDLPFLSTHDTLRKSLILCLLIGGEALSLTGLVLGTRRLRRSLSGIRLRPRLPAGEAPSRSV